MPKFVEKVTAFVTRRAGDETELLLFEHPYAGIQIPAGTVEEGETPQGAALREVSEETGLTFLSMGQSLGSEDTRLPAGQRIIAEATRVYARPDAASFDWAYLRKGITVSINRKADRFSQVTYEECDRVPDSEYVSLRIAGWVPDDVLADTQRRHFFHLEFQGHSEERWSVLTDNHCFDLFWAPLTALPDIIPPQDKWLEHLPLPGRGRTR